MLTRIESALAAIIDHKTTVEPKWLRLAGSGGVFATIRAAEFCSRIIGAGLCDTHAKRKDKVLLDLSSILAQEAWRRWALASFLQSYHCDAKDVFTLWQIFMEAILKARLKGNKVCGIYWLHLVYLILCFT